VAGAFSVGKSTFFFFSFCVPTFDFDREEARGGGKKEVFLLYNGAVFFDVEKKKWGR